MKATEAHRKARRIVRELERGVVEVREERKINQLIDQIEEARLLERLTRNPAFRG